MLMRQQFHADNLAQQKPALASCAALRRLCRNTTAATDNWLAVTLSKPAHTGRKAMLA